MVYASEQTIPRPDFLGGGSWSLGNLGDVTVLAGKNGSGKSVLLRAWRDLNADGVHYVAPERTGEMDFQPNYMQGETAGISRREFSTRNYVAEYRRRVFGRVQAYFMQRGNVRGDEIAPADPTEIERLMTALATDFSVALLVGNPPYELRRIANDEVIQRVDQLSSGEAQLLTLGLDILTVAAMWEIEKGASRIILVDEPDVHIHPDLQVRFSDFLFQVVDRFKIQFVVATHSTSLLSALGQFGTDRTSVVFLEQTKTVYSGRSFDTAMREVAACLGGHALMGPLFGAPILLVEGDDDYRVWAQIPRHHLTNFAVIPSNGDEIRRYQRALESVFTSLSTPASKPTGYALLDGDKSLPIPNAQSPQQFIRFIRLKCRETENLYLSEEVLAALGKTWATAAPLLVAAAGTDPLRAPLLRDALSWDRLHVDLKPVINQIAEILDPKKLLWTIRVGQTLGRAKPSGELAEFLGDPVVDALW